MITNPRAASNRAAGRSWQQSLGRLGVVLGLGLLTPVLVAQSLPSSNSGSTINPESLLVLRDLTVISPVRILEIGPDGVTLSDDTLVPWHRVLVAEHWTRSGPNGPLPVDPQETDRYLRDFGQDWFLLLSRLDRRETFQVTELLQGLQQRYQTDSTPSAAAIACDWLLSRHLADQAPSPNAAAPPSDSPPNRERPIDESEPWLDAARAWLAGQQRLQAARLDSARGPSLERWLPLYLKLDDFPVDQCLGLPLHAPPVPTRFSRSNRPQPRLDTTQPERLLYELVATIQSGNPADLAQVADRLDASLPDWPPARRPLIRHLRQTIGTIGEWAADPTRLTQDSVRFGYLESERRWLATISESGQSTPQDAAMMTRSQIVWEVFLHGLYMADHADPAVRQSGRLRLMLLDYWYQQTPQLRRENTLLGPALGRLLATP